MGHKIFSARKLGYHTIGECAKNHLQCPGTIKKLVKPGGKVDPILHDGNSKQTGPRYIDLDSAGANGSGRWVLCCAVATLRLSILRCWRSGLCPVSTAKQVNGCFEMQQIQLGNIVFKPIIKIFIWHQTYSNHVIEPCGVINFPRFFSLVPFINYSMQTVRDI